MAVSGHMVAAVTRRILIFQYRFCTTAMTSLLAPPSSVCGMTHLDRNAFQAIVDVPCFKFKNAAISRLTPTLKKYFLKIPNLKPIQHENDNTVVYLNPQIIRTYEDIAETDRKLLTDLYESFTYTKLTLNYYNWRCEELLRSILPMEIDVPSSYSRVGHLIHLNLRDAQLPFKNIIGEVLLDKIPNIRTVVNKLNIIDTTFRHFSMEILAGETDTITTVKENGFTYQFDFAQVYWNPRLSTEHNNLVSCMNKDDVLYDVFAGVGPFAIPASHKGVRTFANDLNPEAYKWLKKNAILNKVKGNINFFNMDGRDFLRNIVKTDILNRRNENVSSPEHIVMNLPALAVEFLDIIHDWFTIEEIKKVCSKPPRLHLYCFVKVQKGEDSCTYAKLIVEEKLACTLPHDCLINMHNVRNVAPSKNMIRVSFLLTENVLCGKEPAMKKPRIEDSV